MTTGSALLCCFGVLAALVGLCVIVNFFQKHFESKEYDERQKVVRGRANGLAMWLGYIYFLILFACLELDVGLPLSGKMLIFIGLMVQVLAFHVYCLLQNAALPLGQKPWASVGLYGFMGLANLLNFRTQEKTLRIARLAEEKGVDMLGGTMESARESAYLMLILSIVFFFLAAMHLIRIYWPEKEE